MTEQRPFPDRTIVLGAQQLGFAYGSVPVYEHISFTLKQGESLAVIGPSGCGKSTLLYTLAGLLTPSTGKVTRYCEGVGELAVILQDYGLFPWKTVAENIALPLILRRTPTSEQKTIVARLMSELQLEGLESVYPANLSGGQGQRVAIGRALAVHAHVLLMDEPFSSLDAINREYLQEVVVALSARRALASIVVTHSVEEALFLGQRIMVLGKTPARPICWLDNPVYGVRMGEAGEDFLKTARQVRDALTVAGDRP